MKHRARKQRRLVHFYAVASLLCGKFILEDKLLADFADPIAIGLRRKDVLLNTEQGSKEDLRIFTLLLLCSVVNF